MDDPKTNIGPFDMGIVIALGEEFRELMPWIKANPYYDVQARQYYYEFPYNIEKVPIGLRCVATLIGDMGPVKAGIISERLIERYKPQLIVSIGLSGSMDSDVQVGDVVVADQTDDYMDKSKAVGNNTNGHLNYSLCGDPYKTDADYITQARNMEFAKTNIYQQWQNRCEQRLKDCIAPDVLSPLIEKMAIKSIPILHVGHVASGNTVSAHAQFIKWLKDEHDRKYLAIEMESVGVARAAHDRYVRTLIIRGISDCSDGQKAELDQITNGVLRRYAMKNALDLLWTLIEIMQSLNPTHLNGAHQSSDYLEAIQDQSHDSQLQSYFAYLEQYLATDPMGLMGQLYDEICDLIDDLYNNPPKGKILRTVRETASPKTKASMLRDAGILDQNEWMVTCQSLHFCTKAQGMDASYSNYQKAFKSAKNVITMLNQKKQLTP